MPACIIWAFAYVSVGSLAAGGYRELSRELHWAGYLFVGVIALFLFGVWGVKKLIMRSEAKHMAAAPADEGPDAAGSDPSNLDANR